MKKHFKQLICALAVICLVAGFFPAQAQAYEKKGSYRIYTLSQQKWITVKGNLKANTDAYKITVPSSGYIRVYTNKNDCPGQMVEYAGVYLGKTYKTTEKNAICAFHDKTGYLAVPKGTYYLVPDQWQGLKFKWDFQSKSNHSNYCRSKAESPKAGKNQVLCFNYGYEFTKWYKVKLTKSQKIKVFTRPMEPAPTSYSNVGFPGLGVLIVDQRGRLVTSSVNGYMRTSGVLKAGTYYIRIQRLYSYDDSDYYGDRVISFTWNKQ